MPKDGKEWFNEALLNEMPHIFGPMKSPLSGKIIKIEDLHLELHPNTDLYKTFVIAAAKGGVVPVYDPFADKVFEFDIKKKKSRKVSASKYKDIFTDEMKAIIKKEIKK